MNLTDPEARNYLYPEFPRYYVWNKTRKQWTKRKFSNVIGRVYAVNPSEGERYYLRILLNHVKGATCFNDLKTVDKIMYSTFRESAECRGLLETDNSSRQCLVEARRFRMSHALHRLFATILVFCESNNT